MRRTAIRFVAAGWTLDPHEMGLDHLYSDAERASAEEIARVKAADAALAGAIAAHRGAEDRRAALIAEGRSQRVHFTFAVPMDFGADGGVAVRGHRVCPGAARGASGGDL